MNIGFIIIGIGLIHCAFGFIVFWQTWVQIFELGFFNSIGEDPMRGAVVWFFLFAIPVISYGYLIDWIQKKIGFYPKHLIWHLIVLMLTGVAFMPVSGFWLLLMPIFLLWKNRNNLELEKNSK
jgi:hypothetical protein